MTAGRDRDDLDEVVLALLAVVVLVNYVGVLIDCLCWGGGLSEGGWLLRERFWGNVCFVSEFGGDNSYLV